jgi:hypothetical protein
MGESRFLNDWAKGAVLTVRRKNVLRALQLRLQDPLPSDLVERINRCKKMSDLERWFDLSQTTNTLAEFRASAGI